MGKRAAKFKHPKNGDKKIKGQQWTITHIPPQNETFKEYYQLQMKLPHQQFEEFWSIMKEKLPVVFRVNPSCPNSSVFRDKIQSPDFLVNMVDKNEKELNEEEGKNQPKEVPKIDILSWYPGNILHQINTTKQIFKKSKVLNNLHKYLQQAFEAGLIARQELVSMIPPLFMDVQPDDIILDMCAAPGSKTSQLLEMLYGNQRGLTKGCVIANDADYRRAQMLIHQINRSGTAGMAVINHPGQFMPELYTTKTNHIKEKFLFDKILCDVPCTGDGATRKLPMKWAKWHTSDGISLHPLQLAILMKSIHILKRGGLIVYSTCSLNPIENEAVLSGLLKKVGKGLEIIDIHDVYGVKGRRGMLQWDVCEIQTTIEKVIKEEKEVETKSKRIKIVASYQQVKNNYKIKESMFPPQLQMAEKMQLQNSMRILPHDQNSGGFFIALLRKNQDFEWKYNKKQTTMINEQNENLQDEQFLKNNMPKIENPVAYQNENNADEQNAQKQSQSDQQQVQNEAKEQKEQKVQEKEGNNKMEIEKKVKSTSNRKSKKEKYSLKYENFQNISQAEFQSICKFFGLDQCLKPLLYVRQVDGQARKNVLLISEGVKRFLVADKEKKIKLINMGCKVFQKGKQSFAGHECLYRLSQQGIHFVLPYMKERKVKVNLQFFRSVLSIHSLIHDDIKDQQIREKIKSMSQGSFCIYIDQQIGEKHVLDAMVGQNFKSSFHLMVGKQEIASLNLRYL